MEKYTCSLFLNSDYLRKASWTISAFNINLAQLTSLKREKDDNPSLLLRKAKIEVWKEGLAHENANILSNPVFEAFKQLNIKVQDNFWLKRILATRVNSLCTQT